MVHALPGRVRLRVPQLQRDPAFAPSLVAYLQRRPGVSQVRAAPACASLIVNFDPAQVSVAGIAALLMEGVPISPAPVQASEGAVRQVTRPGAAALICGGLALGLSLFGAPPLLTAGLAAVGAAPIFARAGRGLLGERRLTVDTLDAAAVGVLALRGDLVAASLSVALIAGGEYIRALTARRSRAALAGLLSTAGRFAWVIRGARKERLPAAQLATGDTIVVYPGDLVLVDGVVIRGRALVDQKVLTGESTPVLKQPGGRALEQLARVDTIVFDKTGTLTLGAPRVTHVRAFGRCTSADEVLALAAAAEARLVHPAAEAIVRAAAEQRLAVPEREDSRYSVGLGVQAVVYGEQVLIGDHPFLTRAGVRLPAVALALADRLGKRGASTAFVARDGTAIGLIGYADAPRPEAASVLRGLRDRGVRELIMVTGDNEQAAHYVARRVGITRVEADVFPAEKAEIVRRLQAVGHVVAVIGDGINDSPALAYADVSFSLKAGSDIARETADIVLHGDLYGLPQAIDTAREAMQRIRESVAIVAVPNAAGLALSTVGAIGPVAATALNNGASVAACLNALRPLLRSPASATA